MGGYTRNDRAGLRRDKEACYELLPAPQGAAQEAGRLPLRRRAADAGHQPRAHGAPQAHDARRAVAWGSRPLLVAEIFRIVKRINEERKTTILLVEQNANLALSIADYGYIMENGRIVLDGDPEKLRSNEDVKEFYLGGGGEGGKKSYKNLKFYKRRKRWLSARPRPRRSQPDAPWRRCRPSAVSHPRSGRRVPSPRRPGAPSSGRAAPPHRGPRLRPRPARPPHARGRPASTRPTSAASTTCLRIPVTRKDALPGRPGRGAALRRPDRGRPRRSWPALHVARPHLRPAGRTTSDFWRFRHALAAAGFRRGDVVLNSASYHLTPLGFMLDAGGPGAGLRRHPRRAWARPSCSSRSPRTCKATAYIGTPQLPLPLLTKAREIGTPLFFEVAFVIAEMLPESLRADIRRGSGCGCLQGYGTADLGCLAYECAGEGGLAPPPRGHRGGARPRDRQAGRARPARRGGGHALRRGLPAAPLRHRRHRRRSAPEERCACGRTTPKLARPARPGRRRRQGEGDVRPRRADRRRC